VKFCRKSDREGRIFEGGGEMGLVASGRLRPGEAEYMEVTLRGEIAYEVFVHPDEPGVDFDLRIFDERGNLIEQDTDIDGDAVCVVRPAWTGPFRLVVNSARGTSTYRTLVQEIGE
jgi:hypothetical protein